MRKNIRTSRRNYNTKYYNKNDYTKKRNFDIDDKRRSARRLQENDEEINFFAFKAVICSFLIFALIIVINTDFGSSVDVKDEIKTALSKNMSFDNIQNIIVNVEDAFNSNNNNNNSENSEKPNYQDFRQDFRIDENIIEQMNNEIEPENIN